ncbi:MAG TPA: succinate dehydrogenase hydrophobic membrane anchor subunit [Armatimonadota bacterium]|jgi:succinate dehydrogenase / fumarate reductase membrane anchor subunit|nr:succinate dehydrogenase hydrophobic membrane anchor subunit [Armatimonadota bacterium]HOJ22068.1 succinate dehydrogenase hydrophobic membrane anchor subunit [Armatimonadota bacterium]HOM83200.1 succinate dehydrogenase hydrophobic membrane anchor subunit [Armatimonadota bacterium]HOQ28677.1 succinate dehydrogenase hydrophobic membrane anchor subunit [Armatimonadota bacterium]HPO73866.1 succinate dehydrogenase hydrophobic membrane anchor subunit [Armatimonadota bacterium]
MALGKRQIAEQPRPTGNFELFSWYFMRVSGVVLLFLILGHLAVMHLFGSVEDVSAAFVAERLANPLWRVYDLTMVVLALLHGGNGVRWILDDYVHSNRWRLIAFSTLYTALFVLLVVGSLILLTFQVPGSPAAGSFSAMR